MKAWAELSREDLESLAAKFSGPVIGKMYGVHHNTVYARFQVYGIKRRWLFKNFDPPKEEIERLYQTLTRAQLGEHYGVSISLIQRKLREYKTPVITSSQRLTGKKKSLSHRLAMSRNALASGVRAGEKNGNWKGGVSSGNKRARSKIAYLEWKTAVLSASDWKCSRCGIKHGHYCECCGARTYLHSHHIVPFAENEELRYEPSNGIALCKKCHTEEHHNEMA